MNTKTTLYHRASGGGVKQWSAWIEHGSTVMTEWGLQGAKLQRLADPKGPKGKEGTKAFKTPEQVAEEDLARKIQKKKDEGYVENIDEVLHSVQAEPSQADDAVQRQANSVGFDFDAMPKSFAPAKPIQNYRDDIATIRRLEANGDLILQRKRDGGRHFIVIGDTRVRIFSRRMEDMSAQFAAVCDELEKLAQRLPAIRRSILDTEFVVDNDGKDAFDLVGSICRSDAAKSIRHQSAVNSFFYGFDILYANGAAVFAQPYRARYELLHAFVHAAASTRIQIASNLECGFDEAVARVAKYGWEGLVAWDASRGTVVQLNGKPKRTNCWKVKPSYEDDFVATHFAYGESKFSNAVGALFIGRYDAQGRWVDAGKVGGGFTEAQRAEALTWGCGHVADGRRENVPVFKFNTPIVVQVKFDEVSKDGKLRFPVFQRLRTDKAPEECVLTQEAD